MARDSLDISDDKDDGKKQKETESGDNTNHLDEYRLNRYIISKDPYAFDASGWTLDQIKEHQRLMEMNRDEAEESYELACTQTVLNNSQRARSGPFYQFSIDSTTTRYDSDDCFICEYRYLRGCSFKYISKDYNLKLNPKNRMDGQDGVHASQKVPPPP